MVMLCMLEILELMMTVCQYEENMMTMYTHERPEMCIIHGRRKKILRLTS